MLVNASGFRVRQKFTRIIYVESPDKQKDILTNSCGWNSYYQYPCDKTDRARFFVWQYAEYTNTLESNASE